MELDDLKGAWKQKTESSTQATVSREEMHKMLHIKASNTIDLLKRSVRFEFWITILLISACLVVWLWSTEPMYRFSAIGVLVMSIGFAYYYYKKLILLNKLMVGNHSIKENITNLVTRLEKYLLISRWGYSILVPPCLLGGALFGMYASSGPDFVSIISQFWLWVLLAVILIPMGLVFNLFIKWYLRKLYGDYLIKLHQVLDELHE